MGENNTTRAPREDSVDPFGLDDAVDTLLEGLVYHEWPLRTLSVLEQFGLLDRRNALEAMRDFTISRLKLLEAYARETREYLERSGSGELDDDLPPLMRKVATNIVDGLNGGSHPSVQTLCRAEAAADDFVLWLTAEEVSDDSLKSSKVHTNFTSFLLNKLVDTTDVKQTLRKRLRGEGA